jgi:hypothetical protein
MHADSGINYDEKSFMKLGKACQSGFVITKLRGFIEFALTCLIRKCPRTFPFKLMLSGTEIKGQKHILQQ